jgi:methylmalonyl-CoA mutase
LGTIDFKKWKPKNILQNKVRIVTAASLFDGHDAAINIMRRVIQGTGCEVIHLGHDKSAEEVVNTAIQEDANAIALTSYQGGHNEYFKYIYDLLREKNSPQINFWWRWRCNLPEEIKDLMSYGIDRIYSPDDGRELGLQGMIDDLVQNQILQQEKMLRQRFGLISFENSTSIAKSFLLLKTFQKKSLNL